MPFEPDHVLLRRYHEAQEHGDGSAGAAAWEQLSVNNFDRMNQLVKAFSHTADGRWLQDDEIGSVISEVYIRVRAMGVHFRQREIGQYYAAVYTLVNHTCIDYGRKELRHKRRSTGSLDQRFDSEGESGPFDRALARYDEELRNEREQAAEADARSRHDVRLLRWAIRQISNPKYKEVLELTYIDKLSAEVIAERLRISMQTLYKRRSRGFVELEKILRDHRT